MKIPDVRRVISEIEGLKDSDPEGAHGLRDALYTSVLIEISRNGAGRELAAEALKAEDISLRWEACG